MSEVFRAYVDSIHWAWVPYIACALMLWATIAFLRANRFRKSPAESSRVTLASVRRQASDIAAIVVVLWLLAAVLSWGASMALLLAGPVLGTLLVIGAACVGLAGLALTAFAGGGWIGMLIFFAIDPPKSWRR